MFYSRFLFVNFCWKGGISFAMWNFVSRRRTVDFPSKYSINEEHDVGNAKMQLRAHGKSLSGP